MDILCQWWLRLRLPGYVNMSLAFMRDIVCRRYSNVYIIWYACLIMNSKCMPESISLCYNIIVGCIRIMLRWLWWRRPAALIILKVATCICSYKPMYQFTFTSGYMCRAVSSVCSGDSQISFYHTMSLVNHHLCIGKSWSCNSQNFVQYIVCLAPKLFGTEAMEVTLLLINTASCFSILSKS